MALALVAAAMSSLFSGARPGTPGQTREDAYFAAGLTDEVITRLANLQGLSVISRTTARGYDRKGKTTPQIASETEAYDFYLRGLEVVDRSMTKEDLEAAVRMFQAAVDRDPRFTQALARLARAHAGLYFYYWDRRRCTSTAPGTQSIA